MKANSPAHMEAQLATAAMHFLKRSNLQGEEVHVYVEVHNWLQHKIDAGKSVFDSDEIQKEKQDDKE